MPKLDQQDDVRWPAAGTDLIQVILFRPGHDAAQRTITRGFQPLYDLIGGELEFLGVRSHANGLDELAVVFDIDQPEELPANVAGIRGPVVGIRCDDTGETISLRAGDREIFSSWLRLH
ncbi:MAG: hypothetical protein ABSE64_08190 [Vulcanimicrobiaceae bacterium]|jgi:hypothetical protein